MQNTQLSRSQLLMLLLASEGFRGQQGEPIQGTTRLQKLLFLLEQEAKLRPRTPNSAAANSSCFFWHPRASAASKANLFRAPRDCRSCSFCWSRRPNCDLDHPTQPQPTPHASSGIRGLPRPARRTYSGHHEIAEVALSVGAGGQTAT